MTREVEELRKRIAALEAENRRLRRGMFQPRHDRTVIVPSELQPAFRVAQRTVHDYFQRVVADPAEGTIEIGDQRYVLVRASALSMDFLDSITQLYADRGPREAHRIGKSLLFDIAHSLGISDARNFHDKMGLDDPVARLSAGPVHFAYCGWALVDIKPESNPVPGEDYVLLYDHPSSFEAASWVQAGRTARSPVCIMNAGYSSGWCEESFGIELTAVEVSCQARGDPTCTFVMAPPGRIAGIISERFGGSCPDVEDASLYIPTYFDRKRSEEALQRKAEELQRAYEELAAAHRELKETQAKHIQAGRLASIGELAAGVAHELNSPLQVIQGYATLLVEELEGLPAPVSRELAGFTKKVTKISSASERCKVIVDDLLALSRHSGGVMRAVRLADVVKATFDLIGGHFRLRGVEAEVDVPADLEVWGNANQLQQVVTNIAMNSMQAMESCGGRDRTVRVRGSLREEMAVLEIADSGPGIPEEHLDKLFDPFFTTKPTGQGTGLGLSIGYGIVKSHGGQIGIDSSPRGTVVRITLPTPG
jgi:signal transduction histidine kinase